MHELSSATISPDDDVIGARGSITVHEHKTEKESLFHFSRA